MWFILNSWHHYIQWHIYQLYNYIYIYVNIYLVSEVSLIASATNFHSTGMSFQITNIFCSKLSITDPAFRKELMVWKTSSTLLFWLPFTQLFPTRAYLYKWSHRLCILPCRGSGKSPWYSCSLHVGCTCGFHWSIRPDLKERGHTSLWTENVTFKISKTQIKFFFTELIFSYL